jgi:urease beta subunit
MNPFVLKDERMRMQARAERERDSAKHQAKRAASKKMIPGEYFLKTEPIDANNGRVTSRIVVTNRGDRPIQIGSHCHFFEVNRALDFNRDAAYGMRLNIPAGTAVRFEPGDAKEIELVALAGTRTVFGINGLVNGKLK